MAVQLRSRAKAKAKSSIAARSNQIVRTSSPPGSGGGAQDELAPLLEAGAELQLAYAHFNEEFWVGELPPCMIVYTRKKHCLGHFAPDRFRRVDGVEVAELALHPGYPATRSDRDSLSTLTHEMAHVWRHYLGPLNRKGTRGSNGYHDQVWANEMLRIGLVPSDTGAPDGKMTGYQMTHYVEEGGLFDQVCSALLATGFRINWADRIVRPDPEGDDPNTPNDPDNAPQKRTGSSSPAIPAG